MAGVMLYLPGDVATVQEIARRGAGALLDPAVHPVPFPCDRGPDGAAGTLWIFDQLGVGTPARFDSGSQTWLHAGNDSQPDGDRYWLGFVTADPPGPESLARGSLFDGLPVTLTDGKRWVVPIADYIPNRLTIDRATGEEIWVPSTKHREFLEQCNTIREYMMGDDFAQSLKTDLTMNIPGGMRLIGAALAKNYRVNADLIDALDILDGPEVAMAVGVIIGVGSLFDACEKKNVVATAT